jgi:hypothetical protein
MHLLAIKSSRLVNIYAFTSSNYCKNVPCKAREGIIDRILQEIQCIFVQMIILTFNLDAKHNELLILRHVFADCDSAFIIPANSLDSVW